MRKYNAEKGLTLIEIMISLGILVIISSLMLAMTGTGRTSWAVASAKLYLSSQARQAVNVIQQELSLSEYGTRVILGSDNRSVRFSIPIVKPEPDGSLDLTATGDLKWGNGTIEGYSIEYFIPSDTTNLSRRVWDGSTEVSGSRRVIARDVQSFSIAAPGGTRQYDITLVFSISRYLGTRLPTPITSNLTLTVTPMN